MKRHVLFGDGCAYPRALPWMAVILFSLLATGTFAQDTIAPDQYDIKTDSTLVPDQVRLAGFPNPFKSYINISYALPFNSEVVLEMNTHNGKRMAVVMDEFQEAGSYQIRFGTEHLQPGIYIITLRLRSIYADEVKSVKIFRSW